MDTTKRHALGGVLLVLGGLGVYLGVWLGLVVMVAGVMAINWTGNPEP